MTTPETPTPGQQPGQPVPPPQPYQPGPVAPAAPAQSNTLGLVSLIVAVVGFVFACIPGAFIVGWVLLPAAFVMAIVSLFLKGRRKGLGIAGLIVSIVGTIVGGVVFAVVAASAVSDAFTGGDVVVVEETEGADASATDGGTRENPYPLGTTITNDEWEVTINSVTLNADDAVAAANEYNDPPADGEQYMLVNATVTYVGADEEGGMPAFVSVAYVTPSGETAELPDTMAVAPESLDNMSTLYSGGTATGNILLSVPSTDVENGVLAVSPGMLADKVFYAVK